VFRLGFLVALSVALSGCLFPSLDGFSGGDASVVDGSSDAPSEAGDAGNADAAPDAGGPIASWTFDEDGGTTLHDVTGHGHDGTINGGTWIAGHSGSALSFNGTTNFVSVPASSAFDKPSGASFSITAWVMRAGTFSHDLVLSISYGPTSAMYGMEAQGNTLMNYWDGVNHIATSTVDFSGTWHHMAVVVTSGTIAHSYFDGALVGSDTNGDNSARVCTAIMIGASNYGDHFPGAIDNLRFWGRALTAAEITADMTQ
jgi:hypothetical protein